jgi:hypothetical protein
LDVHPAAHVPLHFGLTIDVEGVERECELVWRKDSALGLRFLRIV